MDNIDNKIRFLDIIKFLAHSFEDEIDDRSGVILHPIGSEETGEVVLDEVHKDDLDNHVDELGDRGVEL
jgi:NTP pyrophosphatase (non-canonical NTP hydrolase)